MDFITATGKTLRDTDEATNQPFSVKAVQITEENKDLLGVTVQGFYYVALYKLEQQLVPPDEYFGFDLVLYSDTNVIRADIGDWLVLSPQKYKLEVQWIGKDAFEARFDVPPVIEPPIVDQEIPDQVVNEIVPEITDGTV